MTKEEWQKHDDLKIMLKSQAIVINELSSLCEELINELVKYRNMDETKEFYEDLKKGGVVL